MKIRNLLVACFLFFLSFLSAQTMISEDLNFYTFRKPNEKHLNLTLEKLIPQLFKLNPDYGILPIDAPCKDCDELIHLRTDSVRVYSSGTKKYLQKGYTPINYVDKNGYYRSVDRFLKPTAQLGEYAAFNQSCPTSVSLNHELVSIQSGLENFEFCKNLKLYFQDSLGNKSLMSIANWSTATVGDNGLYIVNVFPNIDLQAQVLEGAFKTSFIVKNNLAIHKNGWLIISDEIKTSLNSEISYSTHLDNDNKIDGNIYFKNTTKNNFTILQGVVTSQDEGINAPLYFKMTGGNFEMLTNSNWLNDSNTHYPIVIDPIITSSGALVQAAILGSGFNNLGSFTNSCPYTLTIPRPLNSTLSDVTWSFSYLAQNGAKRNAGAVRFGLGTCVSPAATGFYWTCANNAPGVCNGTNISIWSDLNACINPLSSCSGSLPFTLQFFYANAGTSCSNIYIASNSPWTVTLVGNNLETLVNTTTGNGAVTLYPPCNSSATLNPNVLNGVSPYSYSWTPGGQTTSTKTVSTFFVGTQVYLCNITDACGISKTATFNVASTCVLPVELISFTTIYNHTSSAVDINWITASETNSDYFLVEKSLDGFHFDLLQNVKASGQSVSPKYYHVVDLFPNKYGITYYRLKQFDIGNIEKFSKINSLELFHNQELKIIPNPATHDIDVSLSHNLLGQTVDIEIYNLLGKRSLLKEGLFINESNVVLKFNIFEMSGGVYFIKVISQNGEFYKGKLVKY